MLDGFVSSHPTLVLILLVGIGLMVLERIIPDQELPPVRGWWIRVIFINLLQLGVVFLGAVTWEGWFENLSLFHLRDSASQAVQVATTYFVLTFSFYWWHRVRHDSNFLWLTCHQLHHSATRIETITSFYKHPAELIVNGIIISCISFGVLGITLSASAWVTVITALAEFFYHMNICTPQWIGYFLQRPEMHRIHHQRGKHYNNFSDLPVWDMLFGTYENPKTFSGECGFRPEREQRFLDILSFKNVNDRFPASRCAAKSERPASQDG